MKRSLRVLIFTLFVAFLLVAVGITVTAAEFPHMRRGELLTELPEATTQNKVTLTDISKAEQGEVTLSWEPIEGAEKYSVRLLLNINYMNNDSGLNFIYEDEFKTENAELKLEGLQYQRRYTVLIFALDAEGEEIALYDREHIFTYPDTEWESIEPDGEPAVNNGGLGELSTEQIIIIIAAVFGLLVIGVIIFAVIMLKKPKK